MSLRVVRTRFDFIWCVVFPTIFLLSSCAIGYRVDESDITGHRGRLDREQSIYERVPSGGLRSVVTDTSLFGTLYFARDSVFFDPRDGVQSFVLAPSLPTPVGSTSTIYMSRLAPDIDLVTIPLRYRFRRGTADGMMPTAPNVAAYAGLRYDRYAFKYQQHNEGFSRSYIRSGVGAGLFAGFTPVTVAPDKDLPAFMIGAGATLNVHALSFGLAVGFDRLLQDSVPSWHYEDAVWLGLSIGVNLN